MTWLEELKKGDKVIVSPSIGHNYVNEVERTTETLIIVGHTRYTKKDGYEYGGDTWNFSNIFEATPDILQSTLRGMRFRALVKQMNGCQWSSLALDKLERIKAILNED